MGSWRTDVDITSYEQAEEFLGGKDKRRYPVGKVTFIERLSPTRIGVRYQKTIIVEYDTAGRVKLDTGGWFTVTTKAKMNEFLPRRINVYSNMGKWYVSVGILQGGTDYDYADGMVILDSDAVYNTRASDHAEDRKAYRNGQRWQGRRQVPVGQEDNVWQRRAWGSDCYTCGGEPDRICTRCGRGVRAQRLTWDEHEINSSALNDEEPSEEALDAAQRRDPDAEMRAQALELDRRDMAWRAAQMRKASDDPQSFSYVPEFAKGKGKA